MEINGEQIDQFLIQNYVDLNLSTVAIGINILQLIVFTSCRKQYDTSPRYRYDNIAATELDMPERTTQVHLNLSLLSLIIFVGV